MTTRTAANPASPNLKDALTQLSMAVRELVGSQAHAKLMRAATGLDVNAGQAIYQPSKEPTAQTQSRNILSSEAQPPTDRYINATTVLDNDDCVPDLAAASDSDDDSDDDVPSKKQEDDREDDSSHDNSCNNGESEPLIHRPPHVTCATQCDLALLCHRLFSPIQSDGTLRRRYGNAGLLRTVHRWQRSH